MSSLGLDERVITIDFPQPAADLSCGWLVDQAQERFRELGAPGHLVGLKEFGDKADQEAKVGRYSDDGLLDDLNCFTVF